MCCFPHKYNHRADITDAQCHSREVYKFASEKSTPQRNRGGTGDRFLEFRSRLYDLTLLIQLLIDLQVVKLYLTKMPGETLSTASYTRSLNKTTTRLEALLKVIVTPVDPSEGFILNYTLLIGDESVNNFQKVCFSIHTTKD